ncbi:hypothetical protein SAPIO_CDS4949 [Scedosporium apiospermum]|uniref:Prion-inhibition and propagation HeLo domain-containing protein n=1 Tax=Pseudallescheria apiosperma TaxID=563466 RepID=A0A084G7E1_PSEDA|nr:uncharacterized protein SAPIO_CDS4949 [Scedosporium apiospermum]KEZ43253.1 hypothetical protein SAPIO_CDS4949 [Scedosporium apiospermum]
MAELALGVLGVSGLFSATLDVWAFVDAGQGYAQSFRRLRTKLDLQRTLFVNWGKSVGFGTEKGYHEKLDEPDTKEIVLQVLTEIYLILSETDRLALEYGVRLLDDDEARRPQAIPNRLLSSRISANGGRSRGGHDSTPLQAAVQQARAKIKQRQQSSSLWTKAKWAIRDEDKLDRLVRDLTELVTGLRSLSSDFVDSEREKQIANETISDIDDIQDLRDVQEASTESSPLSVSIGARIQSLMPSASTAFYSARSRLSEISVPVDLYGSAPGNTNPFSLSARFRQESGSNQRTNQTDRDIGSTSDTDEQTEAEPQGPNSVPGVDTVSWKFASGVRIHGIDGPVMRVEMIIDAPDDTAYKDGQFRIQFWIRHAKIIESDETRVSVSQVTLRFMTRVCHPLVCTNGYCGWTSLEDRFDKRIGSVQSLEETANDWTQRYAQGAGSRRPIYPPESSVVAQESSTLYFNTLSFMRKPSPLMLDQDRWEAQGVPGVSVVLLGYPAVQTWAGQLVPEVKVVG